MDVFYSAKAGVGCSTIAAATATLSALRQPSLLIDCGGDLDVLLGLRLAREPRELGMTDWLAAVDPPPDALARLEQPLGSQLSYIAFGRVPWQPQADRLALLASLMQRDGRRVIIDCGGRLDDCQELLSQADQSVLVVRACYVALAAAVDAPVADVVVVVAEPGRSLRSQDVQHGLAARRVVSVPWTYQTAQCIDSGLGLVELPKRLKMLGELL